MVRIHNDDTIGALHDRHVRIRKDKSHHRSACLDGDVIACDAAAVVDQIFCIGTDLYDIVTRFL